MPKRPDTVKVDSSGIQGEGSWVEFRRLTWGERQDIVKQIGELEGEAYRKFVVEFMLGQLVSWNWVDKNGKPLKMPSNEEALNSLYPEESDFLVNLAVKAVAGRLELTDADLKN
jgi:hypothetical protein